MSIFLSFSDTSKNALISRITVSGWWTTINIVGILVHGNLWRTVGVSEGLSLYAWRSPISSPQLLFARLPALETLPAGHGYCQESHFIKLECGLDANSGGFLSLVCCFDPSPTHLYWLLPGCGPKPLPNHLRRAISLAGLFGTQISVSCSGAGISTHFLCGESNAEEREGEGVGPPSK